MTVAQIGSIAWTMLGVCPLLFFVGATIWFMSRPTCPGSFLDPGADFCPECGRPKPEDVL